LLALLASAAIVLNTKPVAGAGVSPKVAILVGEKNQAFADALKGLQDHLQSRNIAVDYDVVPIQEDPKGLARVLAKVEKGEVDAVVTLGSSALGEVVAVNRAVPVIGTMILKPDGNTTAENSAGVYLEIPFGVQFEWLRRFLPKAKTMSYN
jgi:phosphoribosylcarboxyaminoimidazole (NCAIR) mutase